MAGDERDDTQTTDETEVHDDDRGAEEREKTDSPTGGADVEKIINEHVGYSMLAGAIPIPIADIAAVTAIQIDMLSKLAEARGVNFDEERGKSVVSSILGATIGTTLGRAGASLVKGIPGIGTLLGIGSQVILAGGSTYALGKVFDDQFRKRGDIGNADVDEMREHFRERMDEGQKVAREMQDGKQSHDEIISTIEKLRVLHEKGVLSDSEFEKTKKELLKKLTT